MTSHLKYNSHKSGIMSKFFNPQNNTSIPFANNISSRNQEKDNFVFDLSHTPK